MALDNLRDFLGALDARGELARVAHPVSVDKQMTEVADRCMKARGGGPALLFERPTLTSGAPARYPVAVNLFGSEKRMALALGVECLDEIGERIATLFNVRVPDSLLGKLAMLPQLAEVAKFPPKAIGGKPPCQELVVPEQDVDLGQFPVPVGLPEDGGPYITLPGVITRDPTTRVRNPGVYSIHVVRSAITPASTSLPTTIPRCTSPRSHCAPSRCGRTRSWGGRPWKTIGSAMPRSGSSCRS